MKLTKKLEAEIIEIYNTYWAAYLKGDMKTFASCLDESIIVYGTAVGEIFVNKKEAVKFYTKTADQMTGKAEFRNRTFSLKAIGETIVVFEKSDLYVLMDGVWTFYDNARITGIFQKKGNKWKLLHQHGSFPDSRTDDGDQISTDKIKQENIRLKEAIKRRTYELENKNRELEIETALEKVRSSALAMNKPSDMVNVCNVISDQLQLLGVKDIRNVQTAIINEQKSTYLNYQYFAAYKEGVIEETDYRKHPTSLAMVEQMKKSTNATFNGSMKGKELTTFREWRKQNNQFPDPILDKVDSAHYYFYSIGQGGLGLSTYKPLYDDGLEIFKRFHNVFTLAYRRFVDIEKAIANAREARIEAALERVRAVSLSMHKSDELLNVCEVLYKEFSTLGFDTLRNAMINIHNDEKKSFINYDYSDEIGSSINNLVYDIHPLVVKQIKKIRSADDAFSETYFTGKDLISWKKFRKIIGEKDDPRLNKKRGLYYYFYSIGIGSIGISTFGSIDEDQKALLKRFRNVFALSYQRYMDIAKAEAQAREAQIETSLEKVRSRTMAMQRSDELSETAAVLFHEIKNISEEELIQLTIGIYNEAAGLIEFRVTSWAGGGEQENRAFNLSIEEPTVLKPTYTAWKQKKKSIVFDLTGKQLKGWLNYRNANTGVTVRSADTKGRRIITAAFFSKGHISLSSPLPLAEETIQLLERFAVVFDGTYTRFLDLKNAEAQAREAKIESSMEKIRSRSLAMQKPEELTEVAELLRKEMGHLGVEELETSSIYIVNKENQQAECWYAIKDIREENKRLVSDEMTLTLSETWVGKEMWKFYRSKKEQISIVMKGDNRKEWISYCADKSKVLHGYYGNEIPERTYHMVKFYGGYMGAASPGDISSESWDLLKRTASVFSFAYTRFKDLLDAAARTREAQIELALERVRAKTMAMQKSDDLLEASEILFSQMCKLGIESLTAGYVLMDKEEINGFNYTPDTFTKKIRPLPVIIPHNETIHMRQVVQHWKKGIPSFVIEMDEEETIKHQTFIAERSSNFTMNAEQLIAISPPRLFLHNFYFKEGYLLIVGGGKLSEEQIDIMLRFTKVFEQTYTRFLDLQKAEAQAREAEIELSLERVRARTMAMQHSEELADASFLLDSQVRALGIKTRGCAFNIYGKNESTEWFSSEAGTMPTYKTPRENIFLRYYEAGLKGATIHIEEFEGKTCAAHYKYLCTIPVIGDALQQMKKNGGSFPTKQTDHVVYFKYGYLLFITFEPVPDAHDIFLRFAKVFEQTYTRFLDLQKAEAQAREAEIQLALERVRAKSLAMQQTSELQEVVNEVAQQLLQMKIDMDGGVTIIINDEVDKDVPLWGAAGAANYVHEATVPYLDIPIITRMKSAIKKRESFLIERYTKEEKDEFMQHLFLHPPWDKLAQKRKQELLSREGGYCRSMSISRHTSIAIINHHGIAFSDADNNILKRFGNVLEQSYTRFLDLKNAEAQAREAQIEAALERVRSRSMAMYTSSDLSAVVFEMFTQLIKLDAQLDRCIIMIVDPQTFGINWYLSGKEGLLSNNGFLIQNNSHPSHQAYLDGWQTKRKKWNYHLAGDEKKEWDAFGFTQTELAQLPDFIKADMSAVESINLTISSDDFGNLIASSLYPLSDIHADIVERFTKVFNQTYTRFLDLQKAEAQNKIIQAENERKTRELEEARELQLAMLPKEIPKLKDFEIAVYMKTATEVGGDYYDFSFMNNGSLNVAIGDATGHGMKAGTMVTMIKSLFMVNSSTKEMTEFFKLTNEAIKNSNLRRMMVGFAMLNIYGNKLKVVNAGMPPVYYYKNFSSEVVEVGGHNLPLGAMNKSKYNADEIDMKHGDVILMLSDGFPELQNDKNEQYGYKKLVETLLQVGSKRADEFINVFKNEVTDWNGNKELEDDITFVVIKVK